MNANEPKKPRLLDHEVDGIRELDNLLPRWWVWLFYITIGFAVVYLVYHHVLGLGDLQAAAYEKERQVGEVLKSNAIAQFEATLGELTPSQDPAVLAQGQDAFVKLCAPCHRDDAGGLVGPNLTDDYWIHGSNYVDNLKIVINGVPEKGMLTWRGVLKPDGIQAVTSYIYTLRGTRPPNPKPPESQQPMQPQQPSEFE